MRQLCLFLTKTIKKNKMKKILNIITKMILKIIYNFNKKKMIKFISISSLPPLSTLWGGAPLSFCEVKALHDQFTIISDLAQAPNNILFLARPQSG
jgi:hypothetical protein